MVNSSNFPTLAEEKVPWLQYRPKYLIIRTKLIRKVMNVMGVNYWDSPEHLRWVLGGAEASHSKIKMPRPCF